MKKLVILIGSLIAVAAMDGPKSITPTKVVNNYFIKSGGCSGSCGGGCKCGKH